MILDGQINGVFTNGLTRTIAQVALANFANVGGLMRDGRNLFMGYNGRTGGYLLCLWCRR